MRALTRTARRAVYAAFAIAVSKCSQLGHWKVCNSYPGRSGSIPTRIVGVAHLEQIGRTTESEYGVAGANAALMLLLTWMTSAFDDRLTEFDRYCFPISAHRAFIGSRFIADVICWFDVRQKQLQSATRTTPSGNRRQRGRIRTIWLRHVRSLTDAGGRASGLSVTDARSKASAGDVASDVLTIAGVNPRRS